MPVLIAIDFSIWAAHLCLLSVGLAGHKWSQARVWSSIFENQPWSVSLLLPSIPASDNTELLGPSALGSY